MTESVERIMLKRALELSDAKIEFCKWYACDECPLKENDLCSKIYKLLNVIAS